MPPPASRDFSTPTSVAASDRPSSRVPPTAAGSPVELDQTSAERPAQPKRKKADNIRQTGLKLPIKGGKVVAGRVEMLPAQAATKFPRKRA